MPMFLYIYSYFIVPEFKLAVSKAVSALRQFLKKKSHSNSIHVQVQENTSPRSEADIYFRELANAWA